MSEWDQMLASFTDEMLKMAGNKVYSYSSTNSAAKPASVTTGPSKKRELRTDPEPTNYSIVHSQQPEAAYDAAAGSKSVPPPPVRT